MHHVMRQIQLQPKPAKRQLINRFQSLEVEPLPMIPPAKFIWTVKDLPQFLGDLTENFYNTEVTSPIRKVMIALSRIEPRQKGWLDNMQNWLSSLNADCDVPEVWDLFLEELMKEWSNHEERMARTPLEAP